ncbi:MAG: diguanylate cyclase [Planctomycetia bacterium]|jgi:diguanylate cyclase (GGDEF)-like protein
MPPIFSNVLLVDDDPAMLRLLSRRLEKVGYSVRQVSSGDEAIHAIKEECPDYLITDWEMPGMSGVELCERVRALDLPQYVYILFLTVRSKMDSLVEGLDVGADDFLSKPVDKEELLARLRSAARIIRLERELSAMARTDSLTGLMTRRAFYETLRRDWERSVRSNTPISCVMLDIDFFKRVNDTYGHPAGDKTLKIVAKLLSQSIRANDLLCRYGGEEFCVILPDACEEDAVAWAERMRNLIRCKKIPIAEDGLTITASFGVSERREDTQTYEEMVDYADQALLCAKQSGRDRVIAFQSLCRSDDVDISESSFRDVFNGVTAEHLMIPVIACVQQERSIGDTIEYMLESRISSSPVINDKGEMVGIVSDKDLMSAMVSHESWNQPIREIMRTNVITFEPETPAEAIYEFLCRVSVRNIPIVRNSRPIGQVSRRSLLWWFRNLIVTETGEEHLPDTEDASGQQTKFSRDRLLTAVEMMRMLIEDVEARVTESEGVEWTSAIVGNVTRLQDLSSEVLANSSRARLGGGIDTIHGMLRGQ